MSEACEGHSRVCDTPGRYPLYPAWWHWDVEMSPHVLKRMLDRSFNETDLRLMLHDARGYHPDVEPGRFVLSTALDGEPWEIIVEPQPAECVLVVVTAYPLSPEGRT